MRKLFLIGLKDLKLMFRDRAALIFALLAPFLLTVDLPIFLSSLSIWIRNNWGTRSRIFSPRRRSPI
jgi:hypothetical protein